MVYGMPSDQGLDRRNDMARACGPYHSDGPVPAPRAVHKPSSCPKLRFLLLLLHWTTAQSLPEEPQILNDVEINSDSRILLANDT